MYSFDIRSSFLSFFEKNGHEIVRSSPLIPHNDPTLLFTNSGMVQFKDIFTGKEKRNYSKATTAQKSLRAGGKHNDLDNVGYTARHHTFFEMLGNFSFADYFKEEAIYYAWNFLTKELQIPKEKLYITVFEEDSEAFAIWKKLTGFVDEKIIKIATNDNFWSMGDIGPCGPCSEIFYDHGDHISGGLPGTKDQDGDRFVEIWNLVFMQYEQLACGKRIPLPKPSIDTGMGLERITAVMQGFSDNFDTDIFQDIIRVSKSLSKNLSSAPSQSHLVIADHIRACSFLIADGVMPSFEGRGYVLRRILRRASRYSYMLGNKSPFLHLLVDTLVDKMCKPYIELENARSLIKETIKLEEEKFLETLGKGLKILESEVTSKILPGEVAFKLYDTYGFPIDLTQDILRSNGITVDENGFNDCMEKQRSLGKKAWVGSCSETKEDIPFEKTKKINNLECDAKFLGFVCDYAVFDQSSFYGESGGQVGDTGKVFSSTFNGVIEDTKISKNGVLLHKLKILDGEIKHGDKLRLVVDVDRRAQIAAHHSATHLLQSALRKVLGNHVVQKGSLVSFEKLRFDFTHPRAVENLLEIESMVNQVILSNIQSETVDMSYDDAVSKGAMALFGEKYEDFVRVVKFGDFSIELCGGTHVKRTGDIGLFKIISEQSVSSGIRRIEAICGLRIINYINSLKDDLLRSKESLKGVKVKQVFKEIDVRVQETNLKGFNCLYAHYEQEVDIKGKADELKKRLTKGVVVVTKEINGRISLVIGTCGNIDLDSSELVKKGSLILGGKGGGGRKDMAQGGGVIKESLKNLINKLDKS